MINTIGIYRERHLSLFISALIMVLLKQVLLSNTIHQPWVKKYLPMWTDSVSALGFGKRVASGCGFHWMPEENNKAGSRTSIKPDGKRIELEVDEHDVPYLMEHRTTAVPARVDNNKENTMPTATPAGQHVPGQDTGQGGPWLVEDDRARRDRKLRSILRDIGSVSEPIGSIDQPPETIEYDHPKADAEEEQDFRSRGDKAFLSEDAKSLTHFCTHLPKNPCCTSCMRAKVNQKRKRRRRHREHTIDAQKFGGSVSGEHLMSNGILSNGIDGEDVGFLLRDQATKLKQLHPAATKTAKECEIALKRFQGPMFSSRILHLYKAGKNSRTCHDTSTPYRFAINGIAEREIRNVLEGTRTLLEHSGLPTSYWPYASRCFCHHANIRMVEGDSAWNRRHKQGHFEGNKTHLGY